MENSENEKVIEKVKENENVIEKDNITESNVILSEHDLEKKRQQDLIKEYYINLQKQKYERFIEITMNQTTYTREEAIASLEKHKGDITLVIKEFLGVVDKSAEREKEQNSKSLHQKRYGVIREYMDNASNNYTKKQEQSKRYNDFLERQKKIKEAKDAKEAKEAKDAKEAQEQAASAKEQ
jgi:NACalpha-BTF3-like transcription factor